ncbi:nuclear transport factor 2 family protein [Catenuloplanes atrovinosus]|uniref:SnoaL-like domain-containing protein n=1 Tax=Catenuloplanes atrovinosus TaxID=137266 RepID=A0AAE3YZD4_9ACTN|nr:nuclear transport factor 2 family protein [Catenuloplanes atrovinosus]MDR7280911.1 hypothetical protein [Catenuloplanes atrovinosus]
MSDPVDRYLAAWNETDPARRRDLVAETFAPDCRYVDPLIDATGRDALDAAIAGAQRQIGALFPGSPLRPLGTPETHHDVVRFRWAITPDGTEPAVIGSDVLTLDDRGLITSVIGFFDRFPAAAG